MRSYLHFTELTALAAALSVIGDKSLRRQLAERIGDVLHELESKSHHRPWFDKSRWLKEIKTGPERWRMDNK